jgi:hypothetical protein
MAMSSGEVISIDFLKTGEDAADFLVKTSLSDEIYSVREWVFNNLIKNPESLRVKEAS